MKENKLSTREWLLIVLALVLIQTIIHGLALHFSDGKSSALTYVSFAGTLVSIILAVIAIIYGFVQSIAQQATGTAVAYEVSKLSTLVTSAGESQQNFNKQINELTNVSEKIDESINVAKDSNKSIIHMKDEFESLKDSLSRKATNVDSANNEVEVNAGENIDNLNVVLTKKIIKNISAGMLAAYACISIAEKKNIKLNEFYKEFYEDSAGRFLLDKGKDEEDDLYDFMKNLIKGFSDAAVNILEAIELIEITENSYIVSGEFKNELVIQLKSIPSSSFSKSMNKLISNLNSILEN